MLPLLTYDFCREAWKQMQNNCTVVMFQFEPDKAFVLDFEAERKEHVISLLRHYGKIQMWCNTYSEYVKDAKDIYDFCAQYTTDKYIKKIVIN